MTAAWDNQAVAQMQTKVAALEPNDLSLDAVNARAAAISHRDWIAAMAGAKTAPCLGGFFKDYILICPQMATAAFRTITDHLANARFRG